jgi:NAD(P)H-flavin reductase
MMTTPGRFAAEPTDTPTLPHEAEVVERIVESPTISTLRLRLTDEAVHARYRFQPGQFNMLYLFGVGEVPISIVSDPEDTQLFDHAIRAVGRVTRALCRLEPGARLGVRGPYGRGWPLGALEGRDVVIVTGGLGCAPVVSVINYILRRRNRYGRLVIVQGVKHAADLIWRQRYAQWATQPDTQVLIAADVGAARWPYHVGKITELIDRIDCEAARAAVLLCGPEGMMRAAVGLLLARGFSEEAIWLSLERSMHCAVGWCGHCQFGPKFVCRDGPVFNYTEIRALFGQEGF